MAPLSIRRVGLLFLLAAVLLLFTLGIYFWLEINRTTREAGARESAAARQEIADALAAVEREIQHVGNDLANWDETRQQLMYSEYYALWRDSRVRDMGKLPAGFTAATLYDKNGGILNDAAGPEPMPLRLPGASPETRFRRENGRDILLAFRPIHADPAGNILLGHLGLKYRLSTGLRLAGTYRFADIDSIRFTLPDDGAITPGELRDAIRFDTLPSLDREHYLALFHASLWRLILVVLSSMLLAAWLLNRLLLSPLRRFSRVIAATHASGERAPAVNAATPMPVAELEDLRRAFNDNQARLAEMHRQLEQSSRDFFDQARRDVLTGAHNRRAFDEHWRDLAGDRRLGRVALMLFDCDDFKSINDTFGHDVGDRALRAIADALRDALRVNDRLYRLGGDEFATVLLDADHAGAEAVAERCREQVGKCELVTAGTPPRLTLSIGIALPDRANGDMANLRKQADLAMYAAKHQGGGNIRFYHEDMA